MPFKRATSKTRILAVWLLGLALVMGCSPTKLLAPKQNLLTRIKLEGVKQADAERILTLYQQKPNSRFPLPKLAIYQLGYSFYHPEKIQQQLDAERTKWNERIQAARPDSVKVGKLVSKRERHTQRHQLALEKGNTIMRLGEAPVIYDSLLTQRTTEEIATFLKSKGFFRSAVTSTDTVEDRRVTVTYRVAENVPFHYSQLDYEIPDTAVARRVLASQPSSLLHVGNQYDEEVIDQERSRIETLLKNAGYFDFRQQYITLEADTSFAPTTVRLRTLIANPPGQGRLHRVYTIRKVNFLTDAGVVRFGQVRDSVVRDSVYYLAFKHKFSTKVLDQKLAVRPGETYSLANTLQTQRQLGQLDVFRFNTVNYRRVRDAAALDSTSGLLDAIVNASPAKKYQETTEFGGTYVAQLPGPFGNVRLKIRNVFGGAERLELGLRLGFEGQYSRIGAVQGITDNSVYTTQVGANANLLLPQFLVPWRANRYLTRFNPQTRINTSYTYVIRPEYTRTNLEGTYDYIWQRSPYHQYVLTPLDLSIVNTVRIDPVFQNVLDSLATLGSPLRQSFSRQFVPSFNATSLYNSNDFNETRDAYYLRMFAEVGGLTKGLYENFLRDKTRLSVYNFAKFNADYRRYYKLSGKTYVVYRLNGGIVSALSKSAPTDRNGLPTEGASAYIVPYDKYFFAGGSSSVRAWKPRRLGPGSYTSTKLSDPKDPTSPEVQNFDIEQPGEVLLEGSVEYRFPLYSFINGALFTDFGNVWALHKDNREGADFQLNRFYREIAVGSGLGLRFDFTFLILRLDIATKVYDPTALGRNKWLISNFNFGNNQTAFNLGIGYPF
ncbi:translocation and assembly module lipoprotein TamL [Hymenobacter jejuensis]|nr:BamA/TamA family outer membrane protein [Hymenobacter jejuensis]